MLDGGHNLARFWPLSRQWTQRKIDIINGWIARGRLRPVDGLLLLQHIWAMTQYHADYALQARALANIPDDVPLEREAVARELIDFVLAGCAPRG